MDLKIKSLVLCRTGDDEKKRGQPNQITNEPTLRAPRQHRELLTQAVSKNVPQTPVVSVSYWSLF